MPGGTGVKVIKKRTRQPGRTAVKVIKKRTRQTSVGTIERGTEMAKRSPTQKKTNLCAQNVSVSLSREPAKNAFTLSFFNTAAGDTLLFEISDRSADAVPEWAPVACAIPGRQEISCDLDGS